MGTTISIDVTIPDASEYTVEDDDGLYLIVDSDDLADAIFIRLLVKATDLPGTVIQAGLPTLGLTEGIHTLRFVFADSFATNLEFSAGTTFIVDTVKPGGLFGFSPAGFGALETEIADNGITAKLLADNGDVLPAIIGSYQGVALDDKLVPYVDDKPGVPVYVGDPATGIKFISVDFTYSAQQIIAAGDGLKTFTYQITDRAGNVGEMSKPREFETLLAGAITTLLAPPVAAMVSNNVITEAEARGGVAVTIPAHVDVVAGLWVIVYWGGEELPPAKIIASNTAQDITATTARIFQQKSGAFDVTYEIYKEGTSGKLMLLGISPPTPVVVDLGVPGTVDPDPSTPWNENLGLPTVRGASRTDNVITVADGTLPATITIPWLTNTTPAVPAFRANDIVTVYWNGTPPEGSPVGTVIADSKTVLPSDEVAGIDLVLNVQVAEHQVAGGDITVTYRGSRPLVGFPGIFNHASSPYQTVTVESAPELPGGPGGLPLVEWTEQIKLGPSFPNQYALNKVNSFDGSVIKIPLYENKKFNDKIDYTYIAQKGGFAGRPDGDEIPFTRIVGTHEVTLAEVSSDSLITLPANGFFLSLATTPEGSAGFQGSGKIDYTVTPAGSTTATAAGTTKINIDSRLPQ
ncbi:MAG TPA: hypothetical protein DIT33_02090 [Pseudomonas sp.]|nr:hypothetical protein [Pseudomonas sp.]